VTTGVSGQTVVIVLAREEEGEFHRCSFPVLGRPVVSYPMLAALHAERVDRVYVSTRSPQILHVAKGYDGITLIERDCEYPTIIREFKRSMQRVCEDLGEQPANAVLLLGNSPCVLSDAIDNAVETMDDRPDIDSVISVGQRHEFSPVNAFRMTDEGLLEGAGLQDMASYDYFIDARLIAVRTRRLLELEEPFTDFSAIYGEAVCPLVQEEGVADIDYPWQVPIIERWLRKNGFTADSTPYAVRPRRERPVEPRGKKERPAEMMRVFISTVPFGAIDPYPLDILRENDGCDFTVNPLGRKLKENELAEQLVDYDVLIAGTEPITARVMDAAPRLKLISRVGIGLDSVDLLAAREREILVSYTPDAPSPAVAELTMGHMLNGCRNISGADRKLREGVWGRFMGKRLSGLTVGVIGTGRIGTRVLRHLQGFGPERILVNDIEPDESKYELYQAELVSKGRLYREADIITLHVPLTKDTRGMIGRPELETMKPGAFVINTSRGGIIDEHDLYDALKDGVIGGAAVDVFCDEPYGGELTTLENCFMTCHMGSCTKDCRFEMEKLATEESIRFVNKEELLLLVPESEYEARRAGRV